MICPRWVNTPAQPIAIDDVVSLPRRRRSIWPATRSTFEIGGPEVVSHGEMMRLYARLRGLRRLLLPVPVLTPRLSGLWLALVTPAQARVGRPLVERAEERDRRAGSAVPAPPSPSTRCPLSQAFAHAIADGAAAWSKIDDREVDVDVSPARAFAPIRRIGGANGWYSGDLLWRVRGWLDRLTGGPACADGAALRGLHRRRRHRRLVGRGLRARSAPLTADFRLPGRGWLEFQVTPLDGGRRSRIRQIATFDPRGVLGRLYWYAVHPFHAVIFGGLLRELARRATTAESDAETARSNATSELARCHSASAAPLPARTYPSPKWHPAPRLSPSDRRACRPIVRASTWTTARSHFQRPIVAALVFLLDLLRGSGRAHRAGHHRSRAVDDHRRWPPAGPV